MVTITHCIADLHLCQTRSDLFALFKHYMKIIAPQSGRLYVLGDLFEAWIGDDCLLSENDHTKIYLDTIALFKDYSSQGGQLFFLHGNRDFLLGSDFEKRTGGKLLTEPYFTNLASKKIAFMHGDSLCTDDIAYQDFKKMVRDQQWQNQFLSLPIGKRSEIAGELREKSKDAQAEKTNEIMDVNQQSVIEFFRDNKIDWLIHGHTHRQANHPLEVDGRLVNRIVLSDWNKQGFYLSIDDSGISENYFSC